MSELRDALRLGHSGGKGQRVGPRIHHQHGANSTVGGMWTQAWGFQTQPYYQILDTGKILFQNVFGDRDAKVHRCTEPNAGKEF